MPGDIILIMTEAVKNKVELDRSWKSNEILAAFRELRLTVLKRPGYRLH